LEVAYPASYHLFEELLISQRNFRVPPVISFQEFKEWGMICGIDEKEVHITANTTATTFFDRNY
jgi:hypothetical protein